MARFYTVAKHGIRGPREIADFVGWKDEMDGKVIYRR
jgi:hypothetical protein